VGHEFYPTINILALAFLKREIPKAASGEQRWMGFAGTVVINEPNKGCTKFMID
jgi:hypothetical protein